jgi:Mn2+/Fe2+ NRAMP family transporter
MKLSVMPDKIDIIAIITIVGGTVGGYISFAGAHRMLDAGVSGPESMKQVNNGAVSGILIASVMRVLLFLASIGVVSSGVLLNSGNPAASVFQAAAGAVGYKIFGVILWSAAITSVVGAAYTSVTFLSSLHPFILRWRQWFIATFIVISTIVFVIVGNPVNILVKAGAINGLILPISLVIILIAANKEKLTKQYYHPLWLRISGWCVALILGWMGISVIGDILR